MFSHYIVGILIIIFYIYEIDFSCPIVWTMVE